MSYGYNSLSNKSIERCFITNSWAYWDNVFSSFELQKICNICTDANLIKGSTHNKNVPSDYRRSDISFHPKTEKTEWIFDRLNETIIKVNSEYFNFDLNGYENIQYSEYKSENLGCYNYHIDMILNGGNFNDNMTIDVLETRKLSMSLLLNEPGVDFEGGDFVVKYSDEDSTVAQKKGRAIFFPSYTLHKVSPVTKGVRKSLVLWVTGPKFK